MKPFPLLKSISYKEETKPSFTSQFKFQEETMKNYLIKKIALVLAILTLCISVTACGSDNSVAQNIIPPPAPYPCGNRSSHP